MGHDNLRCRSCASTALTTFLSLGNLPLEDALLTAEELHKPEGRYPLDVAFCADCTLVQILDTVPPEVLFCQNYYYYSSFSDTLLQHAQQNAHRLIARQRLDARSLVVELASNDGYLLQYFAAQSIPVLGIDPSPGPAQAAIGKGIPTLRQFFGKALAAQLRQEGKRADVLLANNVLAHVPDLNGFVAGIGLLLKDDGVVVIEVPYLKDLIDRGEFDTIYHEHLCYFSVTALVALFRRHGLSLNRVEHYPIHGGSLRLYVGLTEDVDASVGAYLQDESLHRLTRLSYYADFASRVGAIKAALYAMVMGL